MVVLHPGSGKKVSFLPKKVRESHGISFITTRMNPAGTCVLSMPGCMCDCAWACQLTCKATT